LLYACVNAYWGAGGTRLLDTVGGSLARLGHAHDTTLIVAIWGTVALKVAAALLPLLALRNAADGPRRIARLLAWVAAAILTVYGAVLMTVGLLVQADVIRSPASADRRALMWHAYLWDPWFLLWGLLIATALLQQDPDAADPGFTRASDASWSSDELAPRRPFDVVASDEGSRHGHPG
jgi:hypothetical protein